MDKAFLLITFLSLFSLTAFGQEEDSLDCDKPNMTQSEMNDCAKEHSEKVDTALFKAVEKLMNLFREWKDLDKRVADTVDMVELERSEKAFIESQKQWFEYRDAEIRFVQGFYGGSSLPVWVYGRRIELTRERMRSIMGIVKKYEHKE